MPAERFYLPHSLKAGDILSVADAEFHHLVNVMRAKAGDVIEVVNGTGDLAEGVVTALEKKKALITITGGTHAPRGTCSLVLIQAIPRLNRLDFIIEKGTELGIDALWLFPGDRSERKDLSDHQLERCQAVAIAAMKQSGRLYLPEILLKPPLAEWQPPAGKIFFGDISPMAPQFSTLWKEDGHETVAFCVGPESGFSAAEEETLKSWGGRGVRLNGNILRTDTAAVAAVALLAHWVK